MTATKFPKKMLATSIAVLLGAGFTHSALAEGAQGAAGAAAAAEGDKEVEVIQVRGIRGSLKANIMGKRLANSVVDIVGAEDIGKFPDKNVAESLQRVAGVSINRGFVGQGSEVSIRGVNPALTQVLLNGQFVASTAWHSQSANKRSFNMDLMPSELVAGLEVHKSPTASLDEGGVGGTVVMRTRKPLDLDSGTFYASAEVNTNSLADDEGYGGTVLGSWKNADETIGILGAVSTLETIGRRRNAENYWEEGWSASGLAAFDQDRTRDAYDITAQFAASDDLQFTLHYLRTDLDASNTNQNFLTINGGFPNDTMITAASGSPVADNGLPMIGTVTNAAWLADDTNTRRPDLTTDVVDLGFTYQTDNYTLSGTIGRTTADGGNGGNANGLWGIPGSEWAANGVTVDIDMMRRNSMLMAPNGVSLRDSSWQDLRGGSLAETFLTDDEDYAQLDLDMEVEFGLINEIEAGVKYRAHEFSQGQNNATLRDGFMEGVNKSQFASGTHGDFGPVVSGNTPTSYVAINGDAYYNYLLSNTTGWVEQRGAYAKVEEDILAAYVQANFEGEGFRGNVGMRYSETDVSGFAYDPTLSHIVEHEGDYSDWLPSLNLAVDLADDMILRLSAARVMSRPGYSEMTPGYTVNTTTLTGTRGNPNIDPFRATQMDIGVEWYFDDSSLFSAALFSKDIKSFISSKVINEELTADLNGQPITDTFRITVPAQGQGGTIEGLELQFQTDFGNGFGGVLNYTYVDGSGQDDTGATIDLPGTSENSYNVVGYYENDLIEARIAYTYRSDFLAEGTAIGNSLNRFDEQDFLDSSVIWHVTDQLDVTLEGTNLLDTTTYQRHSTGLLTPAGIGINGRRFGLKISYRM